MYSLPVLQQFSWFPGLTPHIAECIPSLYYKNSPDSLAWLPTSLNVFPPCTTTINLIPWPNSPNRWMYSITVLKTIHLISLAWLPTSLNVFPVLQQFTWFPGLTFHIAECIPSLYYKNSPDSLAWLSTSLNVFPPCTKNNSPDFLAWLPTSLNVFPVLQQFTWFPGLTPHIAECTPCTTIIHLISWLDSSHRWMYSLYYNNSPDSLAWLPTSLNVFPVLQQFTWFPGLTLQIAECIRSLY